MKNNKAGAGGAGGGGWLTNFLADSLSCPEKGGLIKEGWGLFERGGLNREFTVIYPSN